MTRHSIGIILISASFYSLKAIAGVEGSDTAMFVFGGFGTLGVVHSNEHLADFMANQFSANGAGFTRTWSPVVDSLLAGQVTANPTSKLSAVFQAVAEQNYDGSYTPGVEWADVKYQFTPDFSVRVGRTALGVFLLTDSRKIGYAHPWVRPPTEVYSLVPVTRNDGIDASYRTRIGRVANTLLLTAGRSDTKVPSRGNAGSSTAEARQNIRLSETLEYGDLIMAVSYGRTHLTLRQLDPLFNAFRQFGVEGAALAAKYDVDNRLGTFVTVSASYDPGDWFITAEWGDANTRSILGENVGWFTSAGYRFRQVTPFITYARQTANSNRSDPGLTLSALPPSLAGPAAGLNATLNAILGVIPVQRTTSLGARWDFMPKADLKFQYDHTQHGAGSPGELLNVQPGFQYGRSVDLFSVSLDFVF